MTGPQAPRRFSLLALTWPLFVEQGLRVLVGTVDTFMVSHVSDGAVAAVGVANQVLNLALMVFSCVSAGGTVVMTHHLGGGDRAGAARIGAAAVVVNTWLGLGVSAAVALLAGRILRLMQLPAPLAALAWPFLALMGGTLFLEARNTARSAVLRAHARTRDAMLVGAGQNVLNALGNLLLLFGLCGLPRLGVLGVAISGVVSRLAAGAALRVLVRHRAGVRVRPRDYLSFPGDALRRILRIGLPVAGENVCWCLAFLVVTSFVARMGVVSLAAQSYALQISTWVGLLGSSLAFGTQIRVGHLVGTGALEDAYRTLLRSLRAGVLVVGVGMGAVALAAPWLLGIFSHDATVVATGALVLRLGLLLEPGRASNLVVINALRATGDARFPVLVAMASMWCVWVALAWLLGVRLGLGLPGVWLAQAADEWLRAVVMIHRWTRRRWVAHALASRAGAAIR